MASFVYNKAKELWLTGVLDMDTDVIKVALITDAVYVPDKDHDVMDDGGAASANPGDPTCELSTTNYVQGFAGAGRKTLTVTVSLDDTNDRAEANVAAATVWTALGPASAGPTIAGAVVYRHLTSDAASNLIAWFDDGGFPITVNSGDFTITWHADGLLQIT